ncbi:hypothetical protein SDC9_152091 [bioreactor metagenome]|uniref:Uncharacterized protein n=1 Tax=bioreactor metagenome TaxID=1076179 RepID=A0A645EWG8_9ZZZZ
MGDSHRDGEIDRFAGLYSEISVGDGTLQRVQKRLSFAWTKVIGDHSEFFPADSIESGVRGRQFVEHSCQLLQDAVTTVMSITIIVIFEMINIDHR